MSESPQIPSSGTVSLDKTTKRIQIEGDIKIRILVICLIGVLLVIITAGGIWGLVSNETVFGKYWQGLQTIVSGTIFGLVGFIAGRSSSERHE
jgi:hypothetical protein